MKNCPHCAQPIYDSARHCPFCGRNLDLELALKLEKRKADRERRVRAAQVTLLSLLIFAGVVVLTVWAAIYSPVGAYTRQSATQTAVVMRYCSPAEVAAAASQMIDLNDRWADIMSLALSVSPDALVVQVDRLQKIRRDARLVEPPGCLQRAKTSLLAGMDEHINGLLAHMRWEDAEQVNAYLTKGDLELNAFADEVERVQRCAPGCE